MDVVQYWEEFREGEPSSLTVLVQENLNLEQKNTFQPDRMVVEFRNLKDKREVFFLEFLENDPYDAVVGRVAKRVCVEPLRISLTRHIRSLDKPNSDHMEFLFAGCLMDMVSKSDKICNVLYYEVLDGVDLGRWKELNVSYGYPYVKISVVLPRHCSVEDLLNNIKHKVKLSNSDSELWLFGIYKHKLCKLFQAKEKIEDIPENANLRVEEVTKKNLGCGHHMIRVYHSTSMVKGVVFGFGEPFLFVIRDDETLAEVKVRIQEKLSIKNEDFSKWKFTLLRLGGRPEYLEDTDIVYNCFEGKDDVLAQYFGLIHQREVDEDDFIPCDD